RRARSRCDHPDDVVDQGQQQGPARQAVCPQQEAQGLQGRVRERQVAEVQADAARQDAREARPRGERERRQAGEEEEGRRGGRRPTTTPRATTITRAAPPSAPPPRTMIPTSCTATPTTLPARRRLARPIASR